MPVQVDWEDESETVVRYQMIGKWTIEELYTAFEQGFVLQRSKAYVVDMIFDMTASDGIPRNVMSITSYARRNRPEHAMTVVITQNGFVKAMAEMFKRLMPGEQHFSFAQSDEEAHEILRNIRAERT